MEKDFLSKTEEISEIQSYTIFKKQKWYKLGIMGQFFTTFRLLRKHTQLTREANIAFLEKDNIKSKRDIERLELIEKIEVLMNDNIGYLFNIFIVLLSLTIAIFCFLLFKFVDNTKIGIDVKVSAIDMKTCNMASIRTERFNFGIESNDSITFTLPSAKLIESNISLPDSTDMEFQPAKLPQPIKIEQMRFPADGILKLDQPNMNQLNLTVKTDPKKKTDPLFTYMLSFQQRNIFNTLTKKNQTIGVEDKDENRQFFRFEKNLQSGNKYDFSFIDPHPWKWSSGLFVKELNFQETDNTENNPISSVLSGKVRMFETNDSIIYLHERDILKVNFKDSAEVFLSGDKEGISIHVEGDVTNIECGPKIMGEKNNRMPQNIKTYSDTAPYIWALLSVLVPFLIAILLRQRKSV